MFMVQCEFMIDHCSYTHNLSSREIKTSIKFRPRTLDLCDTSAVFYRLKNANEFHNCLSCVYNCDDQS